MEERCRIAGVGVVHWWVEIEVDDELEDRFEKGYGLLQSDGSLEVGVGVVGD